MSQQQGIFEGNDFQKLASASMIIGAVVLMVFNILAPRAPDPTNIESVMTNKLDNYFLFQFSHLMIAFGFLGAMIGSAGVYQSITDRGVAWARAGFYGIVVGTVPWIIAMAISSVGTSVAEEWVAAPAADKDAIYGIATAITSVGTAAYIMGILMFWFALVFLGVGMVRSAAYPRWLGWVGVVLGGGMVAIVGIPQYMAGEVVTSSVLIFAGLAMLTTVWFLVIGIWVGRKAW
jgi:hypothetical protein